MPVDIVDNFIRIIKTSYLGGSNPLRLSKYLIMGYIYCITNLINSKRYVGKTTNTPEERFQEHCKDSKKRKYEKRPLYSAMNKYGIENFKIEELEYIEDDSKLSEREIYWINELGTYGSKGYNASKGGDGKILYDHNEIIELANLGYTLQQIADKMHCYKETAYNVLKAHKVKCRNGNSKLIAQYDLAGNYIQTFWGSRDASEWVRENGITSNKRCDNIISKCCIGDLKTAYGYIWKYLPEPI